jgi:hypothetical protein
MNGEAKKSHRHRPAPSKICFQHLFIKFPVVFHNYRYLRQSKSSSGRISFSYRRLEDTFYTKLSSGRHYFWIALNSIIEKIYLNFFMLFCQMTTENHPHNISYVVFLRTIGKVTFVRSTDILNSSIYLHYRNGIKNSSRVQLPTKKWVHLNEWEWRYLNFLSPCY